MHTMPPGEAITLFFIRTIYRETLVAKDPMATVGYQQQLFCELTAIPASNVSATRVSSPGGFFPHGVGP